jgi:hypothetical protein
MLVKFCFRFLKILPELGEYAFIFFIMGWLTFSVTSVPQEIIISAYTDDPRNWKECIYFPTIGGSDFYKWTRSMK